MDVATRLFLQENLIPSHVSLLLEFYGVAFMQDLNEFGKDDVKAIEDFVRSGLISSETNLNQESDRLKFLGSEQADFKRFSFRPLERSKLLKLSNAAKSKEASIKKPPKRSKKM